MIAFLGFLGFLLFVYACENQKIEEITQRSPTCGYVSSRKGEIGRIRRFCNQIIPEGGGIVHA